MKLYFLPDHLLVYQDGKYGSVSYSALTAGDEPTRFIETDGAPGDAEIVGHTWRFVNRDGGPDRRFNNNRQIPIARYGKLSLQSSTGMNLLFYTSRVQSAQEFTARFSAALRGFGYQDRSTSARGAHVSEAIANALRQLGLQTTATGDEIKAAYRRMAVMYHPDKVVQMEFKLRALAEERMKDINAAYAILSEVL